VDTFLSVLPIILGAIPVLFSTRGAIGILFKLYSICHGEFTMIFSSCHYQRFLRALSVWSIIVWTVLLLGTLGAFIFRLIKLKTGRAAKHRLYSSLFLPILIFYSLKPTFRQKNQFHHGTDKH
jgi:uncharacterized membrane protein